MKKLLLFCLLFVSHFSDAAWITSFDEAKKMALASNKFMIVDFWATWCGPCKKMDQDSWSNAEVNTILSNYVQVKIDIDDEKDLANQYGIQSIPNMFIMDGNGKVVYTFMGYHDAEQLKKELEKFAFSTEFLSNDLINYFKMKNYNTSTRVFMKYLDYSLLVAPEVKGKIVNLAEGYLDDAKKDLSKKDENYVVKKQKLDLLSLFVLAYEKKFDKISKKLTDFKESDIADGNKNFYNFLKYISAKGMNAADFTTLENTLKTVDGFDYYIEKTDYILKKA